MTGEEKDIIRADKAALLAALREAGATVEADGARIKCPFHEDKSPSGGAIQGDDQAWRFKCHAAGCGWHGDVFDVKAKATGRPVEDILAEVRTQALAVRKAAPPPAPKKQPRRFANLKAFEAAYPHRVDTYPYTNPVSRAVDLIKLRIEPPGGKKFFVQAHYGADGVVIEKAPEGPLPLFNRTRIAGVGEVIFVEGEKCVKAISRTKDFVATCCPGGGGKGSAARTDLTPLRGYVVILWPDHDPPDKDGKRPGHEHMKEVAEILRGLGCRLMWLDPEKLGLRDKEDAADYLARHEPSFYADALDDAISKAESMGASAALTRYITDAIEGRRAAVPFPFKSMSHLTKALQPGCAVVVCGSPGATKSFLTTQCLVFWHRNGVAASVKMLEEDHEFWLSRVLAQVTGLPGLTDPDWIKAHPEEALAANEKYAALIDLVGDRISVAPEELLTLDDLLVWVTRSAESGARVLAIDPITAADTSTGKPWDEEKKWLQKVKVILRRHGASLLLMTHPKANTLKITVPTLDHLASSQAFVRFSQTVMWVVAHDENYFRHVRGPMGPYDEQVDRTVYLLKTRNSRGRGHRLCYGFCPDSLSFKELGLDVGAPKKQHGDDGAGESPDEERPPETFKEELPI